MNHLRQRSILLIAMIILFSVVNGVLIARRFWSQRATVPKDPEWQRLARSLAQRQTRMRQWEQAREVSLRSLTLAEELRELVETERIPPLAPASKVAWSSLTERQRADLRQAIAGLLRVDARNSAKGMIDYMHDRHLRLAPQRRRVLENYLTTDANVRRDEVGALSDDELYVRYWALNEIRCPQTTLLPGVSRVAVFRWSSPDVRPILDGAACAKLWEIPDAWPGYLLPLSNFHPREPHTVEEQLKTRREALLADAELIVGHDQASFFRKAPYIVRFWHNEGVEEWQPLMLLVAFTKGDGFPTFQNVLF